MSSFRAACLYVCLTAPTFAYDNLQDLYNEVRRQEIEYLKEYLAAHPDAADAGEGRDRLIANLISSEASDEALPMMLARYEAVAAEPEPDVQNLFGRLAPAIVETYAASGRKEDAAAFIKGAREKFASHEMAERIANSLDALEGSLDKPGIGDTMEIAFESTAGEKVDLSGLKDKVVLVDFWATWCGPCKFELPFVKAAYDKHHAAGFEVVGISLDDDAEKLNKYVADKGVEWPQYFDGLGWQNELAKKFGIQSIPATFLIGKDGKIAATDLRGEALELKVAELLAP